MNERQGGHGRRSLGHLWLRLELCSRVILIKCTQLSRAPIDKLRRAHEKCRACRLASRITIQTVHESSTLLNFEVGLTPGLSPQDACQPPSTSSLSARAYACKAQAL